MPFRPLSLSLLAGALAAGAALAWTLGTAALASPPARAAEEGAGAAQPFVAGFEDLPLMPGLTQIPDAGVVFDTPSGRIVEAYAEGPVAREEVTAFYARTLPQLGWEPAGEARYRREGELLRLEFTEAGGAQPGASLTVRFYMAPE